MKIEVARVRPEGSRFIGEEPEDVLDLSGDRFVRVRGHVAYDLVAEVASHELLVRGRVSVPVEVQCSRCAEFFAVTVKDEGFVRMYPVVEGQATVDLTADIREDIVLHLPAFPVCSSSCRGLCPQCGANWNEGDCTCTRPTDREGPWAELDKLRPL